MPDSRALARLTLARILILLSTDIFIISESFVAKGVDWVVVVDVDLRLFVVGEALTMCGGQLRNCLGFVLRRVAV